MSGDTFRCQHWGRCYWYLVVEVRVLIKSPTGQHSTAKNCLVPNINGTEVGNPGV